MKLLNVSINQLDIKLTQIEIAVTADELLFLHSAINESLDALEEWEYHTRTGETRQRAKELMAELGRIYREARETLDNR